MMLIREREEPSRLPGEGTPGLSGQAVVDAQALIEEARRRQRLRRNGICAVVVVLCLLGAGVDLAATRRGAPPHGAIRPAGQSASTTAAVPPADIVAWTIQSDIVVVSSTTGKVLRTLATGVQLAAPGLPNLSVSSNGMVYFDSNTIDHQSGADQIYRVPISGGPLVRVTGGFDPQVSPNGRELAFVAPEPGAQIPYLDSAGGIDIAPISSAGIGNARRLAPSASQLNLGIFQLSWAPDSTNLSFDLLNGTRDSTSFWSIDTGSGSTSLGAAQPIPVRNERTTWNGYWGRGSKDGAIGLGVVTSASDVQHVVTIDPTTGAQEATLFKVPGGVCVALSAFAGTSPSPCDYQFDETIISDPGGAYVLVAGASHTSMTTGNQLPSTLYYWSAATGQLTRLTKNIDLAVWGPSQSK
jgi:hypothetical protein